MRKNYQNYNKKISVILPTLNEFENVKPMYAALMTQLKNLDFIYEIIFIDDNSQDGTIDQIKDLSMMDENVKYLHMSKRFGDQVCLMAGLDYATGDIVIIMDSDLQHPPKYIPEMISEWRKGFDMVVMQRQNAGHKSWLKKIFEILFYKFLNLMSDQHIFFRFSGFSLFDKKVVQSLRKYKEFEPFLRGFVSLVGYNHTILSYKEDVRKTGKTKYGFIKQVNLALVGITSFSNKLLHISLYIGLLSVLCTLIYATYIIFNKIVFNNILIDGWSSIILLIIFFGGVQLITIGILGIYVGKNFIETKKRPRYFINEEGGF